MNNLLKNKNKISYPDKLEKAFSMISFNGNYDIAGTGNLKSILYPAYTNIKKIWENAKN